jgi:hypothetical protein
VGRSEARAEDGGAVARIAAQPPRIDVLSTLAV